MTNKKKLGALLPDEPPRPVIRRGQGVRLSTDAPAQQEEIEKQTNVEAEKSANVEAEKSTEVEIEKRRKVERTKPGYEIRTDLLRAVKRLAVDENRFNYEIIEEALEEYLTKKGRL